MKRPNFHTMLLGHPVVAAPAALCAGTVLFLAYRDGDAPGIGLLAALMLAATGKASQEAGAYRQWKAEWDAMADGSAPRTQENPILGALLWCALVAGAWFLWPDATHHLVHHTLGWVGRHPTIWLIPALFVLSILVRCLRRHRNRTRRAAPVKVVARPLLPVPSIADAYKALPDYAKHLIGGQS
jgi:hypothetical protein